MQGWISIHRSICDNPMWLSEPFTRAQAWVDLLILANHKPTTLYKRGIKIEIKVGEVAWSEDSLAERWKWSRGKVRRYLKELETVQQIAHQNNRILSRIKIVNYPKYQRNGTTSSTTDGTIDNNGNNENKHLGDESPKDMGWKNKSDNDDELPSIDMDTREPERDLEDERKKKVTALIEWAEKVRGKKFLDTPTQRKFINDMRNADISPTDIKQKYQELLVSEYWQAKETLPDFKTVFSNLKNKV